MDNRGYIRITDFGISRPLSFDNSRDASGTPGYMAPEVMCHKTHGFAADYYALGKCRSLAERLHEIDQINLGEVNAWVQKRKFGNKIF